jgi:PleD family two-component response regulator
VQSGEGDPRHILIVEDDPNTAEMLSAYFVSLGYKVTHAAWGEDALKIASKTQPDLVVLDIHLPDIDGYEVCDRLRGQRRTEHTPIIFLTERRERMDRLQGLSLGAVDYITKPFDVQELRIRVRNVLRRSKLDTLLHPITGLPTSVLVEEQMERVAQDSNLALVNVNINGMPAFNDAYGFVTHDDVLRAVTLILQNTAAEIIHGEPFVGQVDAYHFIIIAPANQKGRTLLKRVTKRLNEAISFFYPHREWESGKHSDGTPIPMIEFQFSLLPSNQIPQQGGLLQLRKTLLNHSK